MNYKDYEPILAVLAVTAIAIINCIIKRTGGWQ